MPRFHVYGAVKATKYLGEFDGATKEAAIEAAQSGQTNQIVLCHHCSGQCEDPEIDELTAEPVTGG